MLYKNDIDEFVNNYLKYIPENLQIQFKKDIFDYVDFITDSNFDTGYNTGYDDGYDDCQNREE